MNIPPRYIASIIDAERSLVERHLAHLLSCSARSIYDERLEALVGFEPANQDALRLLRDVSKVVDGSGVVTVDDYHQFLQASGVVLERLSARRDSLIDQVVKTQRRFTGGSGSRAMGAKSLTIGGVYAAIEVCLDWKGIDSLLTRSMSTLGTLVFGLLLTELFYTATRATSSEENARPKGWIAAIAGWLFTAAAVSNNVFFVKDIGSITALSGISIAWGLVLSVWVMDLARAYGARELALYRSPIALLAGERPFEKLARRRSRLHRDR